MDKQKDLLMELANHLRDCQQCSLPLASFCEEAEKLIKAIFHDEEDAA